ncbi:hypothetical protein [Salipaludibacillus neizhouensis]|nr:hypothetical protein [Salipaludibacillus neizhouensis]
MDESNINRRQRGLNILKKWLKELENDSLIKYKQKSDQKEDAKDDS